MLEIQDLKCMLILFCATFGIASLGMGGVFAAAGPTYGNLGLYFISACNLHASIVVSKCMNAAPSEVRTYGDLGYYLAGNVGRWINIITQAGTCFLVPIIFLVISGDHLLPGIFGTAVPSFNTNIWIIVSSLIVLPLVYIPRLKDTAVLCILGMLGAFAADVICIVLNLSNEPFEERTTEIKFDQIIQVFGTLSFSFGTAILTPAVQRQHTDPSRIPMIIVVTMVLITVSYSIIGTLNYFQFGCTAPSTMLKGLEHGIWRKLAFVNILIHIAIAFPITLNPTLFVLERFLLNKDADIAVLKLSTKEKRRKSETQPFLTNSNNATVLIEGDPVTNPSPIGKGLSTANYDLEKSDDTDLYSLQDRIWSIVIRTAVVAIQAFVACMLQSSLQDILNFTGATTVTLSCLILPCMYYLKMFRRQLTSTCNFNRIFSYVVIFASACFGIYGTYFSIRDIIIRESTYKLFHPEVKTNSLTNGTNKYPFCTAGERNL